MGNITGEYRFDKSLVHCDFYVLLNPFDMYASDKIQSFFYKNREKYPYIYYFYIDFRVDFKKYKDQNYEVNAVQIVPFPKGIFDEIHDVIKYAKAMLLVHTDKQLYKKILAYIQQMEKQLINKGEKI